MKKSLSALFLCAIVAMVFLPSTAFALDETFEYITTDAAPATVQLKVLADPEGDKPGIVQVGDGVHPAINDSVTSVTLPEEIVRPSSTKRYWVAVVGTNAFSIKGDLQNVSLAGVEDVDDQGFADCDSLQSVALPKVLSIGNDAFARCSNLQSVTIWKKTQSPTLKNNTVFEAVPITCTLYVPNGSRNYLSGEGWPNNKVGLWPVSGTVYNKAGAATADATVSVYDISTTPDDKKIYTVYVKPGDSEAATITASIESEGKKSISVSNVTGALNNKHIYFTKLAAPSFSPAAGAYTGEQSVTILTADGDATIRYTTDGTEPTTTSTLYTKAIPISSTTPLKAKVFKSGFDTSDTATAEYTITDKAKSVWICGRELTSENPYYHNGENGTQGTADNNATNYNAYFDANARELTLKGLSVVNSEATKVMLFGGGKHLANYALFAEGNLTVFVDGDNSVSVGSVTKTDASAFSLPLFVTGELSVQPGVTGSGTLMAEAKGVTSTGTDSNFRGTAFCSGVTSNTLEVKSGAALTGIASGRSSGSTVFNAGVNLDAVTVSGGTLKGITSGTADSGSEDNGYAISCGIMVNNGNLSLNAGSIEAAGGNISGTASTSSGVAMPNQTHSISITGGSFTAKSGIAATAVAVMNPLSLGNGITAMGSASSDGSSPEPYAAAKNDTYRWVSVTPPPTVTSVAVNPVSVSIEKGGTQTFNATVTGANSPAQTVTWTVEGGVAGTAIDEDGLLTVATNETAATLTVKATSTVDTAMCGTSTVTVTTPPNPNLIEYKIIKGQDGEWIEGDTAGLGFTADANYAIFTGVSVDGVALSSEKYTSQSGSTIVTLKAAYLKTLSVGQHTLRINFTGGYAETHFTIKAATISDIPATGDSSQPLLWSGIALLACVGLSASLALTRRKQQNG